MARKRMISPEIWGSQDISKISAFARLVWIGLFSIADDDGRGNGKASYIKSTLFPNDDEKKISTKMVDAALNEIADKLSIVFYSANDNEYYSLTRWKTWQKVDKPQASKIPPLTEQSAIIRGTIGEQSANNRERVLPNRIEENRIEKKEGGMRAPACEESPQSPPPKKLPESDFKEKYAELLRLYEQHAPTLYAKEYGEGLQDDYHNGQEASLAFDEGLELSIITEVFKKAEESNWIRTEASGISLAWILKKRKRIYAGEFGNSKKSAHEPPKRTYDDEE